jgi:hypothetical protein
LREPSKIIGDSTSCQANLFLLAQDRSNALLVGVPRGEVKDQPGKINSCPEGVALRKISKIDQRKNRPSH